MVYEKKCSECGKVLDFGGRETGSSVPENSIEFDGELYCKECIKEFVDFGTGNLRKDIEDIESKLETVAYKVGIELEDI